MMATQREAYSSVCSMIVTGDEEWKTGVGERSSCETWVQICIYIQLKR